MSDDQHAQKPMTPQEFKQNMERIRDGKEPDTRRSDGWYDPEGGHSVADALMCEVLTSLGYEEGISIYKKLERWYG